MIRANTFRVDEPVFGTMLTKKPTDEQFVAIKRVGFDFVLIDCDRIEFDNCDLQQICRDAKKLGLAVSVRIKLDSSEKVLDGYGKLGVSAFLLPATEDMDRIKEVAKFCAANSIMLLLQIASRNAIEKLPVILGISGVEAAFIGPLDLGHGLEAEPGLDVPPFREAVATILTQAQQSGKYVGVHTGKDYNVMRKYLEAGATIGVFSRAVDLFDGASQEELDRLSGFLLTQKAQRLRE